VTIAASVHVTTRHSPPALDREPKTVALGLQANWAQFTLLVIVNGFVGAMVGLERSVMPLIATKEFGIASATAVMSFIMAFGLTKAFTNLLAGWLADRRARKSTLVAGWIVALPVPFMILAAPSWAWIIAANAVLGVSQGLTWSTTVIMKIDLAGPRRRGLAMGLNEFAGYVALGISALASGLLAARYGLRAGVAYPAVIVALAGLILSLVVRDTRQHVELESGRETREPHPGLLSIFRRSAWSDPGLFSASQAGLVNNLNDGVAWGVFPLLFTASRMSVEDMSILVAIYPVSWGVAQLVTGGLSDRWGRKTLIVSGMLLQGAALVGVAIVRDFSAWALLLLLLGIGTALVYPTLIAAVGDVADPVWRGSAVGVYRLWRDLGYVAGALIAGTMIAIAGIPVTLVAVGILTAVSGIVAAARLPETRKLFEPIAQPAE
jgi:MFS family permease